MNGRRARIVAGMAVIVLLASACSSSGDAGGPLTKAQFIARADKICREANQKTSELGAPTSTDPEVLADFLAKSGRIISDAVGQLKHLQPPKADQQKIDRLVAGLEKSASYFPALIKAVKSNNTQQIKQTAQQLQQASLQGQDIAQSYGFRVCAHGAGTTASPTP
jgi:hypothetical protein